MPLIDKLKPKSRAVKAPDPILWKGPCADGPLGGITFSMLNAFLQDRERFRVKYVLGLAPMDAFAHAREYGNMWHACEEAHAAGTEWGVALDKYAQVLLKKYPLAADQVEKWYRACQMQYPIYVDYWSRHKDVVARTPILQERVFDVVYSLLSGRKVRFRGKWDSVDLIGKGKAAGIYIQENKTKGDIDPDALRQQLKFDLQTMMYLTAMTHDTGIEELEKVKGWDGHKLKTPILGVRYNVVRRPLSGGKGQIKQKEATKNHPAETADEYWKRLQQYFIDDPGYWFMRWNAEVSPQEVREFQRRCLNPLLEHVCDWYDHVTTGDPFRPWIRERRDPDDDVQSAIHWQHPYGCTNMINEGYGQDVDTFIMTGSEVGLRRRKALFEELQ